MTPDSIESLFTRDSGAFVFARWGRPIAPIVFGVEEPTLRVVKGAFEAVAALAGHSLAETDPELGSNCMVFFFRDWAELSEVPDLDRLIPDLGPLVARLTAAKANQYRVFRFDDSGAIQAAFVFLRMDPALAAQPAEELALSQVVQVMLLWSERAFAAQSPLAIAGQKVILRPEIAGVIRAAYDPVLPAAARDASHALRLFARLEAAP
ncbi:hypothetical protein [Pseudooceanicola sp.]|uniref:hypothetical protein n=1 Tax=Pseudooceanicola sp. TaxID=1914328 RepID=UPI003515D17C